VAELADVARLHDNIAALLTAVRAAIIKTWDTVLDEEVRAHPQQRLETLLAYPLNALLFEADGPSQFRQFLASHGLKMRDRDSVIRLPRCLSA
jgi:hypothetical protein